MDAAGRCPCGGELLDAGPVGMYCSRGLDCPELQKMVTRRYWFTPGRIECRPDLTVCPLCGNDPAKCPGMGASSQAQA